MNMNHLLDSIISLLKNDGSFNDIAIVKAYPPSVKPTRLSRIYIALGISEINMHSCSIDCSARAGEVSVFADIFIPFKMDNSCACEVFTKICNALSIYNILSVSASRLTADEQVQASVLKTKITFNDEISFGGDSDE